MKHWLLSASLICFGNLASAQIVPAQLSTTTVCAPVSLSSSAPTAIWPSTTTHSAPYIQAVVAIYNTSASSSVFCSQDVAVSSVSTSTHAGWPVTSGTSWSWTLLPQQVWNCVTASTVGVINIVRCITQ